MMLLKDLASTWLLRLQTRKRKPIKPATIVAFSSVLNNHIIPFLGDHEVEDIGNKQLREFAQALVAKDLSPKTCHELVSIVKQIVASAQDENGNQLYQRVWNNDWILENVADVRDQHQPIVTKDQLKDVLKVRNAHTDKYRVLIALLAATGLRVGELLALRCADDSEHSGWNQDESALMIRTSLWRGKEQKPKTASSVRTVDLSDPVNAMLKAYVGFNSKIPGDYLFSTPNGKPFSPSSLRYVLGLLGIPGFHSLRRWRVSYLKSVGTPDSLLKHWVGHSEGNDITARYDKSADDKQWRLKTVNRVGIGFDLPVFACDPQPPAAKVPKSSRPRKPSWQASSRVIEAAKLAEQKRLAALESLTEDKYVPSDDDLPAELFQPLTDPVEVLP